MDNCLCFFFSSRRRHTRYWRDWSSDVCSSDLAPHESLLVLDATTGQNAINQAKVFGNAIATTGIILAKLDGTAKGGVVLSIRDQLNLPVKFIGLGETPEDIAPFDPDTYVSALLGERPTQPS